MRRKLNFDHLPSLLTGGITDNLELGEVIDVPSIKQLMESFYKLVKIPMAIIDTHGKVLVGVGWQDICTKFHRVHPLACKNCFESDVYLTKGITDGEFRLYKCKNNMWDMATPLMIGGEHKGNLYLGQFFFHNEPVDFAQFKKQARQYNFDEQKYLAALRKVPHIGKQKLENVKSLFLNLAQSISQLSYSNITLAKAFSLQEKIDAELREKDILLNKAQEIAHLGSWSLDLGNNLLTWSDEMYRIFGIQPHEFSENYEGFLDCVHPDDRDKVNSAYKGSINESKDSYEVQHRIFRKNSGELRYVLEKCQHIKDSSGKILRSVGMTHDITDLIKSEIALHENEQLFIESQTAAQIGSYSYDLNHQTWKATPAIYEIFGIDGTYPHTLEGWINCVHPDFRKEVTSELFNMGKRKSNFEHEYKIIRVNDGAELWVNGLGKIECDNQMNPVRLIGTIQDITKRKLAEEALRELNEVLEIRVKERTSELLKSNSALQHAEEKYRTIADYTYDWEYWLDPDGNLNYCSPGCERITGYKASDFIDNPQLFKDIIHPFDTELFSDHVCKQKNSPEEGKEMNYRIIRSDGAIRWINHVCQPVYNSLGEKIGERGSNRDITVKKEIEEQLKTSHQKYELLSGNISDGIFIWKDGYFEYINNAMCQIFGYTNKELTCMKLSTLAKPEYQEELERYLEQDLFLNQSRSFEVECLKKNQSAVFVEMKLNYVPTQNSIYGVMHDVTEKKQLQKSIVNTIIQTEEKERSYFSKELHDGLGPLLSTIRLYLQWSERPKLHKSWKEIIHHAEGLLEEALTTVKEISYKLSPHLLENYGLTIAVQRYIEKIKDTCDIQLILESNVSRRFNMEVESTLYRAIIECINNSFKHSGARNIFVSMADSGKQIRINYTDDGIGFNIKEMLALKKGLGLFNLNNRIQSIGGKIEMYSNPGCGVNYQITVNIQ